MPRSSVEATVHLRVESVERFSGNVSRVRDELDAIAPLDRVLIACHNQAEAHRLQQVLAAGKLAESQRLRLVTGTVRAGFRLVEAGIVVLGSHELFHREQTPAGEKGVPGAGLPKRRIESRAIDSFLELNEGDLVVHVVQGIARYRGMKMLDRSPDLSPSPFSETERASRRSPQEEHLLLEFRDGVFSTFPFPRSIWFRNTSGAARAIPNFRSSAARPGARRKSECRRPSATWRPTWCRSRPCVLRNRDLPFRPIRNG